MPKKEIINLPGRPASAFPLSTVVRCGDMVFVGGIGGRNPQTNERGSFREQLEISLETISSVLKVAGTSLDNVVSVTSWLARKEDWEEYNEIYRRYFPKDPPSRSTVVVSLIHPGMLVEITCIAVMPS